MSRRWTEASHSPSLAVIWANWRFFLMPCWCFEHSQSHPVSLHVDARGCFQWLHRGHCIFDGGAARGFGREAPPPSPISRMTSPSRTMTLKRATNNGSGSARPRNFKSTFSRESTPPASLLPRTRVESTALPHARGTSARMGAIAMSQGAHRTTIPHVTARSLRGRSHRRHRRRNAPSDETSQLCRIPRARRSVPSTHLPIPHPNPRMSTPQRRPGCAPSPTSYAP